MKKVIVIFSLLLALIFPLRNAYSLGSGAYRLEVPDAEALGKGSAFVAQADNPSAVYFNPAGLTQLDGNLNVSLGAAGIQPYCTYKDNDGNKTDRRKQSFVIPDAFAVSNFGLKKFSFGIGGTSYWGLGTYWAEDSFSRYVATQTDLETQDLMFAAAYDINDNLSIGASADYVRSYVNKKKKINNAILGGTGDGDFQLKGRDNSSWGYRLSTLYKLNKRHSFGFMYRSPVDVKYKGKLYLDGLTGGYASAFGTSYQTEVTSKLTLPQSMVLGYCFKPNDKWRIEFDVEWMDWSSIKDEKIDYPSESNATRLNILNNGNPAARDWHSVFSYGLGTEYKVNDTLKLRAGYFFHETPIPQVNLETALPDASANIVTLGAGVNLNKNTKLDFAYAAMFYLRRTVSNDVGSTSGANIDGRYSSFANIYLITLTFKL